MSLYTTTLYNLMNRSDPPFTLFDSYPIFDEEYREVLNKKIVDHYLFREIGFETAEMFKHYVNTKMREIMPYYNKLYLAQKQSISYLIVDKTVETYDREGYSDSTGLSSSEATSESKGIFEDTPDGALDIIDGYATTINKNDGVSMGEATNKQEIMNTEEYTKTIIKNNPNKTESEQIRIYIDNLLNIDIMVIGQLNELFIGLF